jgi:hypothetical protein
MSIPEHPEFFRDNIDAQIGLQLTDEAPVGEVPPMDVDDAMTRAIEKVARDITETRAKRDAIISAARELHALGEAGVEFGSDVWLDAQGRLFDAVKRLFPPQRLDVTGLARGIFTGGAS